MPVPASINDLSTSPGSNSPPGSESPTLVDDYLRFHASCIALLRDSRATRTSATGSLVLPSGTTAQRDGTPLESYTRWNTDLNCLEVYDGAAWVQLGWQTSSAITLTGTSVDQAVPSWARELSIDLFGSSSSVASDYLVQLGTSGGMVVTNYKVFSNAVNDSGVQSGDYSTTGFLINASDNTGPVNGTLNLRRSSTNLWSGGGTFSRGTLSLISTGGNVDLGAAITTVRISRISGTWTGTAYVSWRA